MLVADGIFVADESFVAGGYFWTDEYFSQMTICGEGIYPRWTA
jgi:hypothetical protein